MLAEVKDEYLEFSRPPYAVDPLDEKLVKQARLETEWRAVCCWKRRRWTTRTGSGWGYAGAGV